MADNASAPAEEKPFVKRDIQNSVFCNLFSDKENQMKLYEFLHPEDNSVTVDDFETETIRNILTDQMYNDLGFSVKNKLLFLVEAQSTWSINIIVRIIMYYGETLNNYIEKTKQRKYSSKKLEIPKPEFYVVYTGTDKKNVKDAYTLADEFFSGDDSFINVKVKILQANEDSHDIVSQYIAFTRVLAEQVKKYGRTQKAITETINICKDRDILRDYLAKKEQEVVTIMTSLFSQEEAVREYGEEKAAEGEARGEVRGKILGAIDMLKEANIPENEIITRVAKKYNVTEDYVRNLMHSAA